MADLPIAGVAVDVAFHGLYVELSGNASWSGLPESFNIVDDLSNTTWGYCFLEEEPFQLRKDLFFLSLVEQQKLGTLTGSGRWAWNMVAVREFLERADRLWSHLIHALFVRVHLSTRVMQFLKHQLRNIDRPRNLMFQGEESFFLTRYSKTMNLKGMDSCTPAILLQPLKELLLSSWQWFQRGTGNSCWVVAWGGSMLVILDVSLLFSYIVRMCSLG